MKRTMHKDKKKAPGRLEKTFMYAAFAEAGELYSGKEIKKKRGKGKQPVVCREGETPSGLCVGNN